MSPKQRREPSGPERKSTRADRTCGLPLGPGAGCLRQSPSSPSRRSGSVDRVVLPVRTGREVGVDAGGCSSTRARARCAYRSSRISPAASTPANPQSRQSRSADWACTTPGVDGDASVAQVANSRAAHRRPLGPALVVGRGPGAAARRQPAVGQGRAGGRRRCPARRVPGPAAHRSDGGTAAPESDDAIGVGASQTRPDRAGCATSWATPDENGPHRRSMTAMFPLDRRIG
jgi:hypothetical protein